MLQRFIYLFICAKRYYSTDSFNYTLQFTNFPLTHEQTLSVLVSWYDAIFWPSKNQGPVMEGRCGSHRGGCWWRTVLIGGVWGDNRVASSLCATVAPGIDATCDEKNTCTMYHLWMNTCVHGACKLFFSLILSPHSKVETGWLNVFAAQSSPLDPWVFQPSST